MSSKNIETFKHVLILTFIDKMNFRRVEKNIVLSNFGNYQTLVIIRSSYNNKLKISAPTWYDEFKLPEGPDLVSDIGDYFEYI